MKYFSLILSITLFVTACQKKQGEVKLDVPLKLNIPAFDAAVQNLQIKDLPLISTDDTISYALGIVWGSQIAGKVGLNKISYTFYQGAHDYMVQNKTFTTLEASSDRLDKEIEFLKTDAVYTLNLNQQVNEIEMKSKFDTLSYQLGFTWMRAAKEIGVNKITPVLLLGLTRGLTSDTTLFDFEKADKYLRADIEKQREKKFLSLKTRNTEWLSQNKTRKDVITLPSGLQYSVLKNGKGKSPLGDNVVVINYTAKLIDDSKFESTYDQDAPLKTYPSGVIPALREALPKMKIGSVWEVYVPFYLGYGSGGIKDKVPPFSTLIYKIELLDVE
jgi:FKBP-type peptidyl-prolyl cis-trans isomerase FklB